METSKIGSCAVAALVAALLISAAGCGGGDSVNLRWEKGYAEWVDASNDPRTKYYLRGELKVTAYQGFVRIRKGDDLYLVPRERLVYIGDELK